LDKSLKNFVYFRREEKIMKYGILLYPHPNKRYFEAMKPLCINELLIMSKSFDTEISNLHYGEVEGLELLIFETVELNDKCKKIINSMSNNQVLFEIEDNGFIKPIKYGKKYYLKEDMSSILKYKGKTNEVFTDMMINIGIFSSNFSKNFEEPLNILDPMCGKGTTLYQGLIKGYNVFGIDIDKKDIEESNTFLKKYFEFHHYKHNFRRDSITINGKKSGSKYTFETSDTIENFKNDNRRKIQISDGNTLDILNIYPRKEAFHCIITDLPYGVQHSSEGGSHFLSIEKLLKDALIGWNKVLKIGGTIVIAYNTYNIKRSVLKDILDENGLKVFDEEPYINFEHWVEQAVNRDILVAKK
jgi:hypothetical protein